jgi:hypothetical protein
VLTKEYICNVEIRMTLLKLVKYDPCSVWKTPCIVDVLKTALSFIVLLFSLCLLCSSIAYLVLNFFEPFPLQNWRRLFFPFTSQLFYNFFIFYFIFLLVMLPPKHLSISFRFSYFLLSQTVFLPPLCIHFYSFRCGHNSKTRGGGRCTWVQK